MCFLWCEINSLFWHLSLQNILQRWHLTISQPPYRFWNSRSFTDIWLSLPLFLLPSRNRPALSKLISTCSCIAHDQSTGSISRLCTLLCWSIHSLKFHFHFFLLKIYKVHQPSDFLQDYFCQCVYLSRYVNKLHTTVSQILNFRLFPNYLFQNMLSCLNITLLILSSLFCFIFPHYQFLIEWILILSTYN